MREKYFQWLIQKTKKIMNGKTPKRLNEKYQRKKTERKIAKVCKRMKKDEREKT